MVPDRFATRVVPDETRKVQGSREHEQVQLSAERKPLTLLRILTPSGLRFAFLSVVAFLPVDTVNASQISVNVSVSSPNDSIQGAIADTWLDSSRSDCRSDRFRRRDSGLDGGERPAGFERDVSVAPDDDRTVERFRKFRRVVRPVRRCLHTAETAPYLGGDFGPREHVGHATREVRLPRNRPLFEYVDPRT